MFCYKCGTKAIDDALFCQKCGAKLIKEAVQTAPPPEPIPEEKAAAPAAPKPVSQSAVPQAAVSRPDVNTYQPIVSFNGTPEEVVPRRSDTNTPQPGGNYVNAAHGSDTDICSLLINNIGMCPAIKSAKKRNIPMRDSNVTQILLKSRFFTHGANIDGSDIIKVAIPAFSILSYILWFLIWGIFAIIDSNIYMEAEVYNAVLFMIAGVFRLFYYFFIARKERTDIEEYMRKNAESCGFTLDSNTKQLFKSVTIPSIVLILIGLLLLINWIIG